MTNQALVLRTIGDGSALPRLMPREFKPRLRSPRTGILGRFLTSKTTKARFARGGARVLLGAIVLSFLTLGGTSNPVSPTGGGEAAQAGAFFPDCILADDINAPRLTVHRWPGISLLGDGTTESGFNYYQNEYKDGLHITGWEWYGNAGISWNVEKYQELGISCPPVWALIGGFVSNLVLYFDSFIGSVALTVYGWACDRNIFGVFVRLIAQLLLTSKTALFLNFLPVMIVLVAFWMIYQGLIKQRSSTAIQGLVWVIATTTAALVLFTKPEEVTTTVNDWTSMVGTEITATVVDGASFTQTELCALDPDKDPNPTLRMSQCVIWETFLYVPWAQGQFGPLATQGVDVPDAKEVDINGVNKGTELSLVYMDAHVYNHDQSVPMSSNPTEGEYTDKMEQYQLILAMFNENKATGDAGLSGETYRAAFDSFSGEDWTNRLSIAFVALVALIFATIPMLLLAFSLLVYQLGLVMLFLISPLFFMFGVHPGFGRKILLGWVEMVLSNLLKRLGTAFLLGLLMMLYVTAMTYDTNFFFKTFLVILVSVAILSIRGKILNQISTINLGGGGKGDPSRKVAGALMAPLALTAGAIGAGFGAKKADSDASFMRTAGRHVMNQTVPGGIPNPARDGYREGNKKPVPAGTKPKHRRKRGESDTPRNRRSEDEEQKTRENQDRRTGPRYSDEDDPLFDLDPDTRGPDEKYSKEDDPLFDVDKQEDRQRQNKGRHRKGPTPRRPDGKEEGTGSPDPDNDEEKESTRPRRRPKRPSPALTAAAAGAAAALAADGGVLSGNEQLASLNRIERHLQKMSEAMTQLVNQGDEVRRANDDQADATRRAESRAEKDDSRADRSAQKQDRMITQMEELRNQGETLNRETREVSESARNSDARAQKFEQDTGGKPDATRTAASPFGAPPAGPAANAPGTVAAPTASPTTLAPQGQPTVFQNSNVTVQGASTPGPRGETGAQGPKGDVGFTGRTGSTGETGGAGAQGLRGEKGSRGYTGDAGETGQMGSRGLKGDRGEKGNPGGAGLTGSQGMVGRTGSPGVRGTTGSPGQTGSTDSTESSRSMPKRPGPPASGSPKRPER